MAKKAKQSQTAAAKRGRDRRARLAAAQAGAPGLSGAGEQGKTPPTARPTKTDEENAAEQSANAAAEVARRRHEPGAEDAEGDGPPVGRVDNRVDTSFETQQMPRPARPLTATSAVAERIAPPPPAGDPDEEPLKVGDGFPKKVRAIRMGYLRHSRRRAGDVFLIYNAAEFSSKWMEYAGSNDPEKITTGQQELEKQRRDTLEDRLAKKKAGTGDADVLSGAA